MRQGATGLGIAGFVIGLIAVIVPVVGIYVSGLALAICLVAALMGERPFTIATVVITGVKTFFLSPTYAAIRFAERNDVDPPYATIFVAVGLAAPIVAMVVHAVLQNKARSDVAIDAQSSQE